MVTATESDRATPSGVAPVGGKWRATLLYALLTVVLMYPVSVRPHRLLPADDTDTLLGMYMLEWDAHALTHHPWSIFDANAFYPHRRTLAYQDNLIGTAIFAAPVLWLTGNPVAAMSFVTLLSCVLCGLGAYVLARRVGLSQPAALLCGIMFSFCPARFFRIYQIGLAPVQWIPFTLASLHAYFDGGRRRDLWYALGFFTLQTLTSGHLALFLTAAILTMFAYRLVLGEPVRALQRLRDFGVVGALTLVPAVLVYIPYRMNQTQVGLRRGLGSWGTTPESFLASPTPVDEAIQKALGLGFVNERASGFLFPGWVPVLFAIVAVGASLAAFARSRKLAIARESLNEAGRVVLTGIVAIAGYVAVTRADTPLAWPRVVAMMVSALIVCAGLAFVTPARADVRRRDRRLRWMIPAIALWAGCLAVKTAIPAGDGISGQYYPNAEWTEPAVRTVTDAAPTTTAIRRTWDGPPPPTFSVRWMGYITVPSDGDYEIATSSDDGSRLFIERRLVVDNSGPHSLLRRSGTLPLAAGSHRVVIEFVQLLGSDYAMQVSWARAGRALRPVPSWMFSRRRTNYSSALAVGVIEWIAWICAAAAAAGAVVWLAMTLPPLWKAWGERAAAVRRSPVPLYLVLALVTIAISAGPPYSLWPYIYRWPGFSFIRAPLRFMVMGALPVAVLGAAGFDRIASRLSPSTRRIFAFAVGAALVIEFAAIPLHEYPFTVTIPAADRWVAQQRKPFVVAEVPVTVERYQTIYMLHSTAHWQRTVAGYGGIRPVLSQEINGVLQGFPDATGIRYLAELGVTYVIVHIDMYPPGEWPIAQERLRAFEGSGLRLEYADDNARVYSLSQRDVASPR